MNEVVTGSALFDRFLEEHHVSNRVAAKALLTSYVSIRNWRKGLARPDSAEKREAVQTYTCGAVPAESWLRESEKQAREEYGQIRPFAQADPNDTIPGAPPSGAE